MQNSVILFYAGKEEFENEILKTILGAGAIVHRVGHLLSLQVANLAFFLASIRSPASHMVSEALPVVTPGHHWVWPKKKKKKNTLC